MKNEIDDALDKAGAAIGNEHLKYNQADRIEWLGNALAGAHAIIDRERRALAASIHELREMERKNVHEHDARLRDFPHCHVSNGIDTACKVCGLDLRSEIHKGIFP